MSFEPNTKKPASLVLKGAILRALEHDSELRLDYLAEARVGDSPPLGDVFAEVLDALCCPEVRVNGFKSELLRTAVEAARPDFHWRKRKKRARITEFAKVVLTPLSGPRLASREEALRTMVPEGRLFNRVGERGGTTYFLPWLADYSDEELRLERRLRSRPEVSVFPGCRRISWILPRNPADDPFHEIKDDDERFRAFRQDLCLRVLTGAG